MRKQILLLSLAAMVPGLGASARSLSPAEALDRAGVRTTVSRSGIAASPVMTVGTAEAPALYVFNQPAGGYVVVAADDVAAPVVGFSEQGSFDSANLPDNFRAWLEGCGEEIARASAAGAEPYTQSAGADHDPIGPLMSTLWNQDGPYNILCPVVGGRHCVTGCVATAMAQVMKYHNWPESVADNVVLTNVSTGTLTEDFSNLKFDWANMIDSYSNGYTDVEAQAVGKLMQACGFSVNMNYTPSVSGSFAVHVGNALVNYFKYDSGLHNEAREVHSAASWDNLIYESLKNDGPVIYWGSGNGSHCFVCDGYRSNGYYHFNWGWGGMSDGYFLLNALAPGNTGIGANAGGFNYYQGALVGIKKDSGASNPKKYTFVIHEGMNGVFIDGGKLQLYGEFWNFSPYHVKGTFAYRFYSVKDGQESYLKSIPAATPYGGFSQLGKEGDFYSNSTENMLEATIPADLEDGTYNVYPAFVMDGVEYTFRSPGGLPDGATLVIDYGQPTVEYHVSGDMSVENLSTGGDIFIGKRFKVSGVARYSADGETDCHVSVCLLRADGGIAGTGSEVNLKFSGEGTPFEIVSDWFTKSGLQADIQPGEYTLALRSGMNTIASCPVTVSVNDDAPDYRVTKLEVENANAIDKDNVVCTAYIEGLSGVVDDQMRYTVQKNMMYIVDKTVPVFVMAGQTTVVKFSFKIYHNLLPGDRLTIMCGPWDGKYYVSDTKKLGQVTAYVADESGIGEIEADENDGPAEYFNLQGIRVDGENLAPGIYIRRQGDNATKILVK